MCPLGNCYSVKICCNTYKNLNKEEQTVKTILLLLNVNITIMFTLTLPINNLIH